MGLTVLRDLGLDRKTIMEEYTSQVTRRRTAPAQAIVYAQDAELAQDTGLAQDTEPVQGTDLVQMSAELPQPSLAVASLRRNLEQDTTTTRNVNIKTSHSNPANVSLIGRVFGSLQQSPVGSLMSWKPMSWGSLIQQDTKMTGTTPSSYDVFSGSQLAKAEAKHMRDYVCCGMHFKNLHELLEHHESSHPMKFR
ncbi:unnamed protein product [Cercospora beticola]|nr:unnamed protein product [Cercospora beticola]